MPPHQIGHMLGDQMEGKKQVAPPVKEQKGCACIVTNEEGPNVRCSKDLTPKSKPRPLGKGAKVEIKELGMSFGRRI